MPVDFIFLPVELSDPCGTRHSEGVVNLHYVVVEQVQFPYIRLGKHIYKVRSCRANTVHPMAELNPALLLIRIGGESGEPGVLDGPTHREMVEVLVGDVLEAKDTMHGIVEVTPDTSTPNPGSFGF